MVHVSFNSGYNEWYTPVEYIECARNVLGEIELDPASSEEANKIVRARVFYTIEMDGLLYEWHGNTWMNPPYSAKLISKFTKKLSEEFLCGNIEQAIALVNNATETSWFQRLVSVSSGVVFPNKRIKFYNPDRGIGSPLQGQAFIYLGNNTKVFFDHFSKFGWCATTKEYNK